MDTTRTVLVIDDDRDNAAICTAMLRHHGFSVLVAEDADTGVALAREQRPAVVVTELFARTGTGWAVLEALRALPETAATPVIVLSAHVLPADREAAAGASVFLPKPAYPLHVLYHVRSLCEARA